MSRQPEPSPEPAGNEAEQSRAEQVLAQALNVMAGGKSAQQQRPNSAGQQAGPRLSRAQLLLFAAIIGLLVGIAAGFISLAW
ncbi:MAG: hypothetical protein ABWZ02_13965 [Nakamurella sp.]